MLTPPLLLPGQRCPGFSLFDLLNQDEPAWVGKDREMKVLTEMNAFEDQHEQFTDSLKGVE